MSPGTCAECHRADAVILRVLKEGSEPDATGKIPAEEEDRPRCADHVEAAIEAALEADDVYLSGFHVDHSMLFHQTKDVRVMEDLFDALEAATLPEHVRGDMPTD